MDHETLADYEVQYCWGLQVCGAEALNRMAHGSEAAMSSALSYGEALGFRVASLSECGCV